MEYRTRFGCGGFMALLGVVLVVLKGSGVIDWPWLWVTFPLWFSLLMALLALLVITLYVILKVITEDK